MTLPTRTETPPAAHGVFIIAEAGVNHNGDLSLAKRLIEAAADAQADAVKFQTWRPGELTGRYAYKVDYLMDTTDAAESRYELSNRLALPYAAFRELKTHAEACGILFMSTPDGFQSLDFLVDELDMAVIKVGSTELDHLSFLETVGKKRRPVILSTGLGTLGEVDTALSALWRGGGRDLPVTVLQCTSQYPAPPGEMNLRVIQTFARAFGVPVGLSDHSTGYEASIAAVALGASVIEKHFTLDRAMEGPDHAASLEPGELAVMVTALRRVALMMGDGIKRPTPAEEANMKGIRRSVVAAGDLAAGSILGPANLVCKRPGTGIAPSQMELLLGRILVRDLREDEPVQWRDVQ